MKLNPRQRRAARKMVNRRGIALWWKVGQGKTRVVYKAFATVAKRSESVNPRFLVVARREAFFDWSLELEKLGLDWRVIPVEEEEDFFLGEWEQRPVVYLLSHGKLDRMKSTLVDIAPLFSAVAYDEGWLYKNPQTARCKAANAISARIRFATILSGSVMTAKDLTDVFGQTYAINKHHPLSNTLTGFRSRFMSRFNIGGDQNSRAFGWCNKKGATQRVASIVRPFASVHIPSGSDRHIVKRTLSIPATLHQVRAFDELRKYYEFNSNDGRTIELKNAPSVITKCQQVSDGWCRLAGEERVQVESNKLSYLETLVESIIEQGDKVIIWTAFIHSARIILQRLQKRFGKVCFIKTGKDFFDPVAWKKHGMICVSTEASGSSVNHFSGCAYSIYYSMNYSWLHLQQSMGRTDRADSTHKTCYYYFLMTEGSLDSTIYHAAHQSGKSERQLIDQVKIQTQLWLTQERK